MKVGIRDKSEPSSRAITGEMGDTEVGYISEMVTDADKLATFGFDAKVIAKATALKEASKDEEPEFPVVRVEEGWSGSRRLWPARELDRIVDQTNTLEPVGHLGHIPDDQAAFSFPDPQTTWFGAIAKTEPSQQKERLGEQVRVAYFAGYNYPGAKVRQYIKTKAVRGISWWGEADQVPIPGKGVEVRNFTLKALDWARKLSEGMPTSRIVAIAREMEDRMDKELSQVTPEEFKRENPNGYALLVAEAQAEQSATIGEMETKIKEGEKHKTVLDSVLAVLGIEDPEALVTEVTKLKEKVGAKAAVMVKDALAKLMEEKVPDEDKRALVMRLVPVGEMETKAADAKDGDEVEKIVGEMLDTSFDKDDMIQKIIGEMQPPVVRRREDLRSNTGGTNNNPYMQSRERVTLS